MEKVKCTVGQLFGKIPACDKPDVVQNIYAFRFVIFCMAIYSVENIMNIFNIFIVDKKIFSTGYFFCMHFCNNIFCFNNRVRGGTSCHQIYKCCRHYVHNQFGKHIPDISYGNYSYDTNCNCRNVYIQDHIQVHIRAYNY